MLNPLPMTPSSQTMETPRVYNTGEVLYDLPSPYLADKVFGLLHLPRFLAKIRKHLAGALPKSYQRNFTKGFDGFLCLHLGIEPQAVIELVRSEVSDAGVLERLKSLLLGDVQAAVWNRKLVQIGMSPMGQAKLQEIKTQMGLADRQDLLSFADIIEVDENRLL